MLTFLTGVATEVDVAGLMNSITSKLGDFSTDNLIVIVGAVLGITAGLVLFHFGFNYAKRKLMGALKKGKL